MAYVAVDEDGEELSSKSMPLRDEEYEMWIEQNTDDITYLKKGSIEKLIGKKLTWEDEPVELEEVK